MEKKARYHNTLKDRFLTLPLSYESCPHLGPVSLQSALPPHNLLKAIHFPLYFGIALLLILSGCFARPSLMNRETYNAIHTGTPISEVKEIAGAPYSIHDLGGGREEYEYIERLDLGQNLIAEIHYFLILVEGRVISKRYTRQSPPAFDAIYKEDATLSY